LYDIEEEKNIQGKIKFVILKTDFKEDDWRVQAISVHKNSFENRVDLLFKGLRDDELSKAAGISDGVFVHMTGFIGGVKSKDSAIKLAIMSLEARSN